MGSIEPEAAALIFHIIFALLHFSSAQPFMLSATTERALAPGRLLRLAASEGYG